MKKSLGAKTLIYPTPVLLVGSYDSQNRPNLATVAWGGVCSSKPPSVAISLRKATYSHGNISEKKAFTVNIPPSTRVREADYAGIYSGRKENKFEALSLTPLRADHVDAPFVAEFPLILECRLLEIFELGMHTQFVGEILDVKADEEVLGENGLPDIKKVDPLVYATGSQEYYALGSAVAKAFAVGKK